MPFITLLLAVILCCSLGATEPGVRDVRVAMHLGRPMIFVDNHPLPMAGYCPAGWIQSRFARTTPRFYPHHMNYYNIMPPTIAWDMFGTQFWVGDTVTNTPQPSVANLMHGFADIGDSARDIIAHDPDAVLFVRFYLIEPESWRTLHPKEYALTEDGAMTSAPSLASDAYWDTATRYCTALVQYCESQPWSDRLVGYVNLLHSEGLQTSVIEGWLYDHNPHMVQRWRAFLRAKYHTDEVLRAAYRTPGLTLDTIDVPTDKLRGNTPQVASLLYWQGPEDNQPLRDYLELMRQLFHQRTRQLFAAMRAGTKRSRIFLYDMFKQPMQGWNCGDFFNDAESRRLADPDLLAASGSMGVAGLLDTPGFDGLMTPHDYQARGVGGVFEPEGIADSTVLRGKLFLCEMDQRTYADYSPKYGQARNLREYEAISWRNIATALTRGFSLYWMDLNSDWYRPAEIHRVIDRQVAVIKAAVEWPHATTPGIAIILDDSAVLETNGSGNYLNEAVMWQLKEGLARCGVPYRVYLLDDLALPNFPAHRVFYFPNLFKVDDARLALLRKTVLRNGNVVVWGPGSGISDGNTIGSQSAQRLTGFRFRYIPVNFSRRTMISNFEHPITRTLAADCVIGGPLSYGPLLFPLDGTPLGLAWTKNGEIIPGLAVKTFGRGARGDAPDPGALGAGDYASVFTSALPLPADIWRNLARYAGAHIYCNSNDVLLADSTLVALHSMQSGEKRILLPGKFNVFDVITDKAVATNTDAITFNLQAPETRIFRLAPAQ